MVGGYARCNDLTATSFLAARFGIERLPVTVPGEGSFVARMWRDVRRTRRCLRDCAAPIVHLTLQYYRGTYREYAIYRMAKRHGRRFVLDIRAGCFVDCYDEPRARLRRRLLREMILGADAITVEGRAYIGWLSGRFGRESTYFPNFVQSAHREVYPSAPLEEPVGSPVRLVYSGRLVPGKGLAESIAACAALERRGRSVELHLAGPAEHAYDDELRAEARRRGVSERVIFHGRLDHDGVLRLLASSHVFLFPSTWWGEGHSNAVNEAMQVGLPIVTTRHGFLGDVVTSECGQLLARVGADTIGRAVEHLCGDWPRLRAAGQAARERVYREFSDVAALERLAEVYERLLASSS